MKHLLFFVFFLIAGSTHCMAQNIKDSKWDFTSWGESIKGVQIAVAISNSDIVAGSTIIIGAKMRNSSTNTVSFGESSPEAEFCVLLTNNLGKAYQMTPKPIGNTRVMVWPLKAGEEMQWEIELEFDRHYKPIGSQPIMERIPSGDYTLQASRYFRLHNEVFEIFSNPLKITIK
jgi:hypothetical protein